MGVHQYKFRRAAYWTVPAQAYFGRGYARSIVSDRQPDSAWVTSPAASLRVTVTRTVPGPSGEHSKLPFEGPFQG